MRPAFHPLLDEGERTGNASTGDDGDMESELADFAPLVGMAIG